jgi:hypothetical protein
LTGKHTQNSTISQPMFTEKLLFLIRSQIKLVILSWFLDRGLPLTMKLRPSWSHHIESVAVTTMTWLIATEYLCHKWPRIVRSFPCSYLITGIVTKVTRRVSLVEQEPSKLHVCSTKYYISTCQNYMYFPLSTKYRHVKITCIFH